MAGSPRRRHASGWTTAVVAGLLALAAGPAAAAGGPEGMDLTTPVLQSLRRLQTSWQRWTQSFQTSDRDGADAALEEMLSNAEHLGMPRLPDLSVAAALSAVKAAEDGDFDKAKWALEAAEDLDPGRPETEFVRARVERAQGRYLGAIAATFRGYRALPTLPVVWRMWRHGFFLWVIFTLGLAGIGFVAVQMATKGPALLQDLRRFLPPGAPRPLALAALALVLVWPLFLPSGLLWVLICWSVLLWSYSSASERVILALLWLFVAGIPLGMAAHQREVQLTLSPPTRALSAVATGRLSGTLFTDLGVLHTVVPESQAVRELVADLHRRLGQWEYARSIYTDLQEQPGLSPRRTATALLNLGVYHHRKGDYATAINFFGAAADADRTFVAPPFDLAQAYSQAYRFSEAHEALGAAREIDSDQVNRWLENSAADPTETAIAVDGGVERIPEIEAELMGSFGGSERPASTVDSWRRYVSLLVAAAAAALAVAFGYLRRQLYRDAPAPPAPPALRFGRWTRTLIPGFTYAVAGNGALSFLGVAAVAAIVVAGLMGRLGYRMAIAYQPWGAVVVGTCVVGLIALYALRWLLAAREIDV